MGVGDGLAVLGRQQPGQRVLLLLGELEEAQQDAGAALRVALGPGAGYSVADRALQLHGGYGYLAEYGIEKIVRDLRVHQILEGTNEIMRVIVARGLTEALG